MSPQLRFSEFNGEWLGTQLGNTCTFSKGKGISKGDVEPDGKTPCVRYGQLYTTYGELINEVVSATNLPANELFFSEANDVIIPASGETHIDIATASCVKKAGIALSGDINVIRGESNGVFLAYYLNGPRRNRVARYAQGSSVIHLYAEQLKLLEVYFPCAQEQQKIADFLTSVDTRIQQLKQKQSLLQQYKKGLMQQLFSQTLRFKDDNGNTFPDWDHVKLGKAVEVNPRTSSLPEEFLYIDLESVKGGRLGDPKLVQKADAPSRAQRGLKKSDILFQTVRPYQKNNFFFSREGSYVASTGYAQLRTTRNSPQFIYQYLHLDSFVSLVLNRCTGTSYPAINSSDLADVKIKLPCVEEQTKIANALAAMDKKIDLVAQQIEHTQTFKKGLLQQMFV
jgi:type I restriction enzyme S subunit